MRHLSAGSLAIVLLLSSPAAAGVELREGADGRLALAADADGLSDVLAVLGARAGFVAELAPAVRQLPVSATLEGAPEEILAKLLRGTNHVVVRNEDGRAVRVMVVGLVDPDRSSPITLTAEAPEDAGSPPPDTIGAERELIRDGKAPDTGEPSGIAGAMGAAADTAARERQRNWSRFASPANP